MHIMALKWNSLQNVMTSVVALIHAATELYNME
jgi:hypothetical protein